MKRPRFALRLTAACLGLTLTGLSQPVFADTTSPTAKPPTAPPPAARQCFSMRDWSGWKAVDEKTLLLRVNLHDIWRVDLASECGMLTSPGVHLVTEVRGTDQICTAIDLDLKVADQGGFNVPCFVKTIRQLSKEEAAAVPKKDLP